MEWLESGLLDPFPFLPLNSRKPSTSLITTDRVPRFNYMTPRHHAALCPLVQSTLVADAVLNPWTLDSGFHAKQPAKNYNFWFF